MKLLNNFSQSLYLVRSVLAVSSYEKPIEEARSSGDLIKEKALISEVEHLWANRLMEKFDVHMNVVNPENLPKEEPVVFVSNHQGYADILPFLTLLQGPCGFIAKEEFRRIPKLGRWIERIRGVYIDRGDVRASLRSINTGVEYFRSGFSMCIFPEGTRSHGPHMGEFKPGSFKLATKAGAIIVPVTLRDTYKFYEERNIVTRGVSFDVVIHPPVDTKALSRTELAELPDLIEKQIAEAL